MSIIASPKYNCSSNKLSEMVSFVWTLQNLSSVVTGKPYESSDCSSVNVLGSRVAKWKLTAVFKTDCNNTSVIISPSYVAPQDGENSKFVKCEVHILDSEKGITLKKVITEKFTSERKHYIKFNNLESLYKENYFQNDMLNIYCKIIECNTTIKKDETPIFRVPVCDLKTDFSNLLQSGIFSDVILSCQQKDIQAHKSVLACRSPVFKAMFSHEMQENKENRIVINDMSPEVLEQLLRYIYSGDCNIQDNLAKDLLDAAEKHNLSRLKMMIANILWDNLSADTACDVLVMAEKYRIPELKEMVTNFISFNKSEVESTHELEKVLEKEKPAYLNIFQ